MAPPALVATAGAANANVYVTRADATLYFSARPNAAAWTAATDDNKDIALLYATQVFEWQRWLGVKGISTTGAATQALSWPRRWAPTLEYDAPPDVISDYFIDITVAYYSALTIPAPIWKGTCELALELLNAGTTDPFARAGNSARDLKSKRIDVLAWEYLEPTLRAQGLGMFPSVLALVGPLLRSAAAPTWDRA